MLLAREDKTSFTFIDAFIDAHVKKKKNKKTTRSHGNLHSIAGGKGLQRWEQKGVRGGGGGHVGGHRADHNGRGTNAICRVTADSQSIRRGLLLQQVHVRARTVRITRVGIPIIPRECDE